VRDRSGGGFAFACDLHGRDTEEVMQPDRLKRLSGAAAA